MIAATHNITSDLSQAHSLGETANRRSATSRSVLFVGAFPEPATLDRYVSGDLAMRLRTLGWRTMATSRRTGKLSRLVDMTLEIWRARNEYEVACIDVFSGPAFVWAETAALMLRRLKKPYAMTLHGGSLPEFAARWPRRTRRLLGSAKIITAPSGYLRNEIQKYSPPIRIVPNPIDINLYPCRERGPLRPRLVWLRAFHEIYNPTLAVKVIATLATKYPDIRLTMVGPDKDGSLQKTKVEAMKLGVSERIDFYGAAKKSDVPTVLSAGDIFLNTTNIDNTPVSVVEAMACGLCVVTTRVGGTPYLVRHERDGLLVECNDVQGMASAVDRLLKDDELARRLSRTCRETVREWDWSKALGIWVEILSSLETFC